MFIVRGNSRMAADVQVYANVQNSDAYTLCPMRKYTRRSNKSATRVAPDHDSDVVLAAFCTNFDKKHNNYFCEKVLSTFRNPYER